MTFILDYAWSKHFTTSDYLPKSLQSEILSAVSSHRLTLLARDTIVNMRSNENSQNYYQTIVKKVAEHPQIEQPFLRKKRKRPNYSLL